MKKIIYFIISAAVSLVKIGLKTCAIILLIYFIANIIPERSVPGEETSNQELMSEKLPAFYFSVLPGWYHSELCLLNTSPLKSAAIGMAKEGLSLESWRSIQQKISTLSAQQGKSAYETLRFQATIPTLITKENELNNRFNDHASLSFHLEMGKILKNTKKPVVTSWLPTIHWWGNKNQFHAKVLSPSSFDSNWLNTSFANAIWLSFVLGTLAFLFASIGGTLLGLFYINGGKYRKRILQFILQVLYVFPVFCLAIIAVQFFTTDQYGSWLNWFPGVGSFLHSTTNVTVLQKVYWDLSYLLLPALLIAIPVSAGIALRWHTGLQDESKQAYVLTLRAKGLSQQQIYAQHLLRNVSLPIFAYLALLYPALISGSLLVENIFAIPGLGRLTLQAINRDDMALLLIIVGCMGMMTMIFNKVVLWATRFVDPRFQHH